MAKQPWEMTRSAFYREFVFHVTSSSLLPDMKARGMTKGSFMIGHVPDCEGDLLVMARRSGVEGMGASLEGFGKGEAIRPLTDKGEYVAGPIPWGGLIVMGMTRRPHHEIVAGALARLDAVPGEVLGDYPDLRPL